MSRDFFDFLEKMKNEKVLCLSTSGFLALFRFFGSAQDGARYFCFLVARGVPAKIVSARKRSRYALYRTLRHADFEREDHEGL